MFKKLFRLLLILLALVLLRAALSGLRSGAAESRGNNGDTRRAVIGADLNEAEIATVYSLFGVERGSVTELKLSNTEERAYLQSGVDTGSIGTRTVS